MSTRTYFEQLCLACHLRFTQFGWPRWRVRGYCSSKCDPAERKAEAS